MSTEQESEMALTFFLSDFGQTFATRERGAELRQELLHRLEGDIDVMIDFAGVTNLSYSFADEFLGKLCADDAVRIQSQNASPRVMRIASRATERRAGFSLVG